jgi:hypothetical protein
MLLAAARTMTALTCAPSKYGAWPPGSSVLEAVSSSEFQVPEEDHDPEEFDDSLRFDETGDEIPF